MAQYYGGARMVQHKADLAVCGAPAAAAMRPLPVIQRQTGWRRRAGGGRITKVQLPSFRVKASVFRHSATLRCTPTRPPLPRAAATPVGRGRHTCLAALYARRCTHGAGLSAKAVAVR